MHQGPRFEARVNLAIERESKRYFQRILKSRKADIAAFETESQATPGSAQDTGSFVEKAQGGSSQMGGSPEEMEA
jgi:hypothetical protein